MSEVREIERKPMGSFVLSLIVHGAFFAILGGVIVFQYVNRESVEFTAPPAPPPRRIEPRKIEYKVRMQEDQQRSGRPAVTPRLIAMSPGQFLLTEIKTSVKTTPSKSLSSLLSFGDDGIGDGLGGGLGRGTGGGLGIGMSAVNFFGAKTKGERIAFIFDVSKSMLEDEKGGAAAFKSAKKELAKMVRGLSEGTFFNVYMFANGVDAFQPAMALATPDVKERIERWLAPYNIGTRYGNLYYNYTVVNQNLVGAMPAVGGSSRLDLALTAAFEHGADTIFILTDGVPNVNRPRTTAELKEMEEMEKKYAPGTAARKAFDKEVQDYHVKLAKENQQRAQKGLAPKIVEVGGPGLTYIPTYNEDFVLDHINELVKAIYIPAKRKEPRIYTVGYGCDQAAEEFLRTLSSKNHGNFRMIKPRQLVTKSVVDEAPHGSIEPVQTNAGQRAEAPGQ